MKKLQKKIKPFLAGLGGGLAISVAIVLVGSLVFETIPRLLSESSTLSNVTGWLLIVFLVMVGGFALYKLFTRKEDDTE